MLFNQEIASTLLLKGYEGCGHSYSFSLVELSLYNHLVDFVLEKQSPVLLLCAHNFVSLYGTGDGLNFLKMKEEYVVKINMMRLYVEVSWC